jgi:membrane protease YdiL (CAAX protease family)
MVRALELVGLFVLLPAAFRLGLVPLPRLKLLLLFAVAAWCGVSLWRDRTFERRELTRADGLRHELPGIGARAAAAALVVALVVVARGGMLLDFPRTRPVLFAVVLVLYPVLSAWPQELIYRAFFFHRYRGLLGERGTVAGSALAFALLHLVYADPLALVLTLPAGLVLARRYHHRRSLLAVAVEHALYGTAVFTLGLGRTFFVAVR